MSQQLKRILKFGIGFVLINLGISLYFFKVSVADLNLARNERYFRGHVTEHIPVLYLGNSRSTNGLARDTIEGLAYFANGGETSVQSYFKFKHLLVEEKRKIDTVVFPVELMAISAPRPTRNLNSYYWSNYVDYLDLGKQEDNMEAYLSVWIKSKLFPWYEYPYIRLALTYNEMKGWDRRIGEAFKTGDGEEKRKQARIAVSNLLNQNSHYTDATIYYMDQIFVLCEEYDVHPVFIKFPLTIPFKEVAREEMEKEGINWLRADSVLEAHRDELTLLDYTDYYDSNQAYFKDMHHLSKEGKIEFTGILKKELNWRYLKD